MSILRDSLFFWLLLLVLAPLNLPGQAKSPTEYMDVHPEPISSWQAGKPSAVGLTSSVKTLRQR